MPKPWKPTKEQLLAATEKTVRDVIAPDRRSLLQYVLMDMLDEHELEISDERRLIIHLA